MFVAIALSSMIALAFVLSLHRYDRQSPMSPYVDWVGSKASELLRDPLPRAQSLWEKTLDRWGEPARTKWVFFCFVLSAALLAVTGFGYAFFSRRGLPGYPLLLHVFAGAVYAISLCLVVILRAGRFALDTKSVASGVDLSGFRDPSLRLSSIRKILFWTLVSAGFLLIASALSSMVPLLPSRGATTMVGVHRYSALCSVLAGVPLWYLIQTES